MMLKPSVALLGLCLAFASLTPQSVEAQSHPWQKSGYFTPYSRTAEQDTGGLTLMPLRSNSGKGRQIEFAFDRAMPTKMRSLGVSKGTWSDANGPVTGEVFQLEESSNDLGSGVRMCRGKVTYLSITAINGVGSKLLSVALFDGKKPPASINDKNICVIYNYNLPAR